MTSKRCTVELCYGLHYAKGMCNKHWLDQRKQERPLMSTYNGMKNRCYNPNTPYFYLYGGQGIKVCERWLNSFDDFTADMGERPSPQHSIDRINPELGYTPENCRWATPKQQRDNARPRGTVGVTT